MPITINGDGTITGLSAGGLPNDSITLANMAHGTDGQIITYDASGAPVALGPGSDGEVLTSTGSGSPPAFETAVGGKILQFQEHVLTSPTAVNSNTTTYVDSGLTKAITCADNNNKVLVMGTVTVGIDAFTGWSSGADMKANVCIHRTGGTSAGVKAEYGEEHLQETGRNTMTFAYIDNPTSTDALTYKFQIKRLSAGSGSANVYLYGGSSVTNSLYLFELEV